MRTFPIGRQTFGGVPFVIGEGSKSIIVLASDRRPGADKMPEEVTIPVGYPVEGFYFLHDFAFAGTGLSGLYEIQYADGGMAQILLYYGENSRDWVDAPGTLAREKGTTSAVAWTGSCVLYAPVAVYRMLWVNPRPGVPVKAVRFANPARATVPILLGLTAVVSQQ